MKLMCPNCRREIPIEDVNVEKDIALCRTCNETFNFSELVRDQDAPPVDLMRPPKGVWFKQNMGGFEIGSTTRSGAALFIVPFMCVWSGFSMGGIYGRQIMTGRFNLAQSLFGIPFLLGTLVLGSIALMTTFGKVVLTVSGDQGKLFTGVGPIGGTRRFKWSGVREVSEGFVGWSKNGRPQASIVMEGETRLTFGSGIKDDRRYFIVNALRGMLRKRAGVAPVHS